MKKFLPLLVVGLLSACAAATPSQPSAPEAASVSSSQASVSSESGEWKSIVLVDQDYNVTSKGKQWLTDIGTKLITGHATQARLSIDLSRGNDDKGWSAIGMYIAPQRTFTNNDQSATFTSPDESVFGTNLHFIAAEWRGDCARHLAPSSSFGVLKEHSNQLTVELSGVPATKGSDGCETGTEVLDLLSVINDGGLYIGFMPSNQGYHAKVTLEYVGDLTVAPF